MLNEIFTRELVLWLMAAVVGAAIGAYVRGLVSRRMRSVGGVKFLRTRIVAEKPHDAENLAANLKCFTRTETKDIARTGSMNI